MSAPRTLISEEDRRMFMRQMRSDSYRYNKCLQMLCNIGGFADESPDAIIYLLLTVYERWPAFERDEHYLSTNLQTIIQDLEIRRKFADQLLTAGRHPYSLDLDERTAVSNSDFVLATMLRFLSLCKKPIIGNRYYIASTGLFVLAAMAGYVAEYSPGFTEHWELRRPLHFDVAMSTMKTLIPGFPDFTPHSNDEKELVREYALRKYMTEPSVADAETRLQMEEACRIAESRNLWNTLRTSETLAHLCCVIKKFG